LPGNTASYSRRLDFSSTTLWEPHILYSYSNRRWLILYQFILLLQKRKAYCLRFEVHMLVSTTGKIMAFWNETLCSLVDTYLCFWVMYCLHLRGCDTVILYLSTRLWHHIPYDCKHGHLLNSFAVCLYVFGMYWRPSFGGHSPFCYDLVAQLSVPFTGTFFWIYI
jgi:hypothetical protein